jgi:hypothetical protein
MIGTIDLLLLASSDQLLFMLVIYFSFLQTPNKEANRTEPAPSVRVVWLELLPKCLQGPLYNISRLIVVDERK